jgi:GntR family transcriptional repressor for pyruvate dehydrogenase complex
MTPSPTSARNLGSARHLGDLVLRPVRGHHAFEGCVEQLATAIRLGAFSFGSALPPERELAEKMGVSRATLREAIAGLRAAGMVSTTRGRGGGTVVSYRPATPALGGSPGIADRRDELLDSLVYRRVVEPGACYVAATRTLTAGEKMLLTTTLAEVDQAEDAATHRQADSRLHLAIASVTGSPMTIEAVTEVQACLHDMLQAIPVLEVNIEHSSRQHRSIVEAIIAGNATKARRAMEQHCDDTAALLRGLLG